jgi:hypothetical protein
MASRNRIRWDGLDQLKADLRALPANLGAEGGAIVEAHADIAIADIDAAYPTRTGRLRKGLKKTINRTGRFGTGAVIRNNAPHAYIFEHGTKARHNAIGAFRGSMPAGNVFIPRMQKWRRRMYQQLAALLERAGLRVTGSFDANG